MEAEEDDALKEHQPPTSPLPMKVADSCRQQVACEGGVGGGGELATVLGTVVGVARDESGSGGGGNGNFAAENSGVVEVAGGVDGREGVDGDVEGEGGGGSGGSGTADEAVGVWGVAGAVGDEAAVRDSYVVVTEEGVDNEGGFDRDNEIEVEEDKMAVDVVGICEGLAEKAEFIENADIREADGLGDLAAVVEEGIETEGGYENESGIEMKEDVVEGGEFQGRVVGIYDEVTEKGKLRESAYTEEANVVVSDVAEGEEDVGVGGNREELIKDGGIDNKVVAESQEDVVAADVDDSGVSKEEMIVAMAVEGDEAALVMEDKEEVDIGSHDVGMDKEVVEVNESKKVGVSEFFPNLEFTSGVIALSMEKTEIAASKGEISLAENEEVTGGDRESTGVVGMVNEITTSGEDIDGMDVGINAGVNGAAETDERGTMDPTTIGEEKEQDDAAARVVGKLSDDATIEADETNGMSNMDSTEDDDRRKVGDVGAEIDVEADIMEQDDAIAGVVGELSEDATIEADETNGMANVDSTEGADRKEVGDVAAEIDVEADEMEGDDASAGVVGELSDDVTIKADETNANVDSTEGVDRKEVGDVAAEIDVEADEMERDDASAGVVGELSNDVTIKADETNANVDGTEGADRKEVGVVGAEIDVEVDEKNGDDVTAGVLGMLPDNATIEAHETNRMARVDSTEDADGKKAGDTGTEIDVEADDVEEDNVLEDKEMDDFVEESQVTEYGDKPEETDVTEDTDMAEEEMEKVEQRKINVVLNRKGGKKGGRTSTKKKLEEDVCFICFDGGDLVLCDRRGCPKVYHPSCVNRDEAFFQTKGQWNCGWHLCSSCKKNPHYFCYTCTFSLCKGCIKDGIIYVVRGNKGFCDICMRTVRMIESVIQGDNAMDQVDFDDKTSWEYLFKDYYMDLKEKLSISAEEIEGAKNPWKGADSGKQEFQDDAYDDEVGSDDSAGQSEVSLPKKRKAGKRIKSRAKERKMPRRSNRANVTDVSRTDGVEWATKELLDFVMHMKDGDRSVLSQFDVQALLLEYIKSNQLRDPRRKSQIICDSRLQSLFGKPRVGHFEMLKLLESHFLLKDDTGDLQGSVVDVDANQADADHEADISLKARKQKKRKPRKRGDDRVLQSNIDDYAAIDVHNITLIYLRRSLVEDLLEDTETFDDKAIGSFVRIRIPGNNLKQEMYRLVPIIGTSKVSKPYKVGKKHTHYVLEIQNLGKPETIQIDIISNQEFTQDECLRLRQSIKYGVTNRLTVGDIQDKAIALQEVRVKDWLDAEIVRLSHLRDRASEKGHAKELRECVEKLQLLKTPQERQRRLNEVPEIHTDPKMDPNNESDDDEDISTRGRSNASGRKSREPISPSKGVSSLNDSWSGIRTHSFGNRELTRSMSSKGYESWSDDGIRAVGEGVNQNAYMQARERDLSSEVGAGSTNARLKMESSSKAAPETPVVSLAANTLESVDKVNESKKMWHYKDPSGKIQGPFSIVQLRKWNSTGYFPVDLRIWRVSETPDDSLLLSDALKEKFLRDRPKTSLTAPAVQSQYSLPLYATNQSTVSHESEPINVNKVPPSVEVPKFSTSRWSSGTNLPSPTPHQTPPSTIKGHKDEVKWSSATAKASSSVVAQSSTPSLVNTGGITGADVLLNVSSVLSQDPNVLMNAASALMAQSQSALLGQQRLTGETHVQNSQASDMKNPGSTIQNLVQAVQGHNPAANLQGWGSAAALPETSGSAPSQRSGQWGEPPMQNPAFYGTGSSAGAFSNHWRPNSVDQSNFQSAAVPSANWGVNNSTNVFAAVAATNSQSQPNPNHNWMQAPGNTGWAGSALGNANMNWSGNANVGMPAQGRPQGGGPVPGWNAPPSQGAFGNTANPGMVAPAQAPLTQNSSFGSSEPGNRGGWMGEKNHNDGRYRGGGDSGYGGGRPWGRQSSFGGGGGGRDQGVCWFQDEYGNCRRGASCKFKHAGGSSGNLG